MLGAVGHLVGTGTWTSGLVLTNPADGALVVDTGPLTGSSYLIAFSGSTSANAVYDVQWRDATNTTNKLVIRRRPQAGNDDFIFASKITLLANERVRCVMVGAITGDIQLSAFVVEVG
jgi:hypothetical protein